MINTSFTPIPDVPMAMLTALPLTLQGVGAKVYQLAWAEKFEDMNAADIEAAARSIAGTARSMGVDVA